MAGDADNFLSGSHERREKEDIEAGVMICDRVGGSMQDMLLQFWSRPMTEELRAQHAQLWTSALSLLGEFFENDFVLWDSKADNFGSSEGSLTDLVFVVFCSHTTALLEKSAHATWREWLLPLVRTWTERYFGQYAPPWQGESLYWASRTCYFSGVLASGSCARVALGRISKQLMLDLAQTLFPTGCRSQLLHGGGMPQAAICAE